MEWSTGQATDLNEADEHQTIFLLLFSLEGS